MARTSGRAGRPWRRAVEAVKARSQVCHLCGDAIDMDLEFPDPMSFSVDHLVPLSEMDEDDPRRVDPDWLAPAHLSCNSSRQNMSLADYRDKQRAEAGHDISEGWSRRWL